MLILLPWAAGEILCTNHSVSTRCLLLGLPFSQRFFLLMCTSHAAPGPVTVGITICLRSGTADSRWLPRSGSAAAQRSDSALGTPSAHFCSLVHGRAPEPEQARRLALPQEPSAQSWLPLVAAAWRDASSRQWGEE